MPRNFDWATQPEPGEPRAGLGPRIWACADLVRVSQKGGGPARPWESTRLAESKEGVEK